MGQGYLGEGGIKTDIACIASDTCMVQSDVVICGEGGAVPLILLHGTVRHSVAHLALLDTPQKRK